MTDVDFVAVAATGEVPPGSARAFRVGDRSVLICNTGTGFHATGARCTHAAWPLDGAPLEDCAVVCTLHGARFDVRDGSVLRGPASKTLECYALRIVGDRVEIGIPRTASAGTNS